MSAAGWDRRCRRRTALAHRNTNARLAGRSREEFVALMSALKLPKPKLIDVAIPANLRLGAPA